MRVLVTGAAGLVGSHLAQRYAGGEVFALTHRDLDITDPHAVSGTIQRLRPQLIFNCAVIGVDDCEDDPQLAEAVNVAGPRAIAVAGERIGAAVVHFSTNYVFDGARNEDAYTIDDEPRPVNVYGSTKLAGERAVTDACSRAINVRTSWVFGAGKGSFLATAAAKLAAGETVRAITDTWASTTFASDLVARVAEIVERGVPGTYQVVNEGVCSYESFAREAARLAGVPPSRADTLIERVTEASLGRRAPRPAWTPMRCLLSERLGFAPMRRWEDALAAYVSHGNSARSSG